MKYIKIGGAIIAAQNINMFGCGTCSDNKETDQVLDEFVKYFGVTKDDVILAKSGTVNDISKITDINSFITTDDEKKVEGKANEIENKVKSGCTPYIIAKANAKSKKYTVAVLLSKNKLNASTEEVEPINSVPEIVTIATTEQDIDLFVIWPINKGRFDLSAIKLYKKKKKAETQAPGTPTDTTSTTGGEGK